MEPILKQATEEFKKVYSHELPNLISLLKIKSNRDIALAAINKLSKKHTISFLYLMCKIVFKENNQEKEDKLFFLINIEEELFEPFYIFIVSHFSSSKIELLEILKTIDFKKLQKNKSDEMYTTFVFFLDTYLEKHTVEQLKTAIEYMNNCNFEFDYALNGAKTILYGFKENLSEEQIKFIASRQNGLYFRYNQMNFLKRMMLGEEKKLTQKTIDVIANPLYTPRLMEKILDDITLHGIKIKDTVSKTEQIIDDFYKTKNNKEEQNPYSRMYDETHFEAIHYFLRIYGEETAKNLMESVINHPFVNMFTVSRIASFHFDKETINLFLKQLKQSTSHSETKLYDNSFNFIAFLGNQNAYKNIVNQMLSDQEYLKYMLEKIKTIKQEK
jgi:hypothetical protein